MDKIPPTALAWTVCGCHHFCSQFTWTWPVSKSHKKSSLCPLQQETTNQKRKMVQRQDEFVKNILVKMSWYLTIIIFLSIKWKTFQEPLHQACSWPSASCCGQRFLSKLWMGHVQDAAKCKQNAVTPWDSLSADFAKGRVTLPNQASNVIHFFIMHNITSVFLLCKLFLLLFLGFPFLVLGYLGHLQPVGHLPVGTKWTAWSQNTHTSTVLL